MSETPVKKDELTHHVDDKPLPLTVALTCAANGVKYAFTTQRNFKIHVCFAIAAIVLNVVLQVSMTGWLAVIVCIAAVFSLELVNTSIEAVVDMVSPGWHELAMRAKDCAAGAVYIFAIASLVIAAIIYIPAFFEILNINGWL